MKTIYSLITRKSKVIIFSFTILTLLFFSLSLQAQTNPTPQALPYSQDFSGLTGTTPTFPAGWQAGQVSTSAPSSAGRTSLPTVDKAIVAGNASSTTSGAYDFVGKIGFLSVGSSDVELCLALNTTGNSNIKISFDAMTIRNLWDGTNSINYQNGLVLQYRVGSATAFTPLAYAPAEYLSGTTVQTSAVTTGINPQTGLSAFLPAECENQASVQIRWIYRNVPGGTSGSRPSMALDNISVQQIPVTFTSGWPKVENPTSGGFTVKSNINTPGKTYFVVLPGGATAPTPLQISEGKDASGTVLASNLQGFITNTSGSAEYVSAITGLAGNTSYDVYFVAQGNSAMSLRNQVDKVSASTSNATFAPTITGLTVANIVNTTGVNTATLGGNITSDGGSPVTERGTVWKTSSGVTIADNKQIEGSTNTGVFTNNCTGFPSKTKIYFRAYATNAINTSFTDEGYFYTIADEPTSAVGSFTATPTNGSSTALDLSWTPATGADGYLIIIRAGATGPGTVPSDTTLYAVGTGIGTGTVAAFVNSGSTTSATIDGLASNQLYTIRIYPFGYDGSNKGTINYAGGFYSSTTGTTSVSTGLNTYLTNYKLSVLGSFLKIEGAKNSKLKIFNITSQNLLTNTINSDSELINLRQGIYFVNINGKTTKVLINN